MKFSKSFLCHNHPDLDTDEDKETSLVSSNISNAEMWNLIFLVAIWQIYIYLLV